MAGIYIHIPFCHKACHYCNFHFSTSLRYKNELLQAILKEIHLRSEYLENEPVETVYVGGGTPSLLEISEISLLLDGIRNSFPVSEQAEITLEANPDDISKEKITGWKEAGINRLSIGIQSFFQEDLLWMNRAHTEQQAKECLELSTMFFENITADLIYGHPLLTDDKWKENINTLLSFDIPHLSCYALTVEPKTPLQKMIREKKSDDVDPEIQAQQFLYLMDHLGKKGFEHYEISNFARPGFRSRHNASYWNGEKYLGLGPAAHSYNGHSRQWNVSNNNLYIESIQNEKIPFEKEILTDAQKLNEYIMTSLRTAEGVQLEKINTEERNRISTLAEKYIRSGKMKNNSNRLMLTREGKLFADGIAADLFADHS